MAFAITATDPFAALNIEILMFTQQLRTYGAERIIMNTNLIKYISNIIDMVELLLQKSNIGRLEYKIKLLSTKILNLYKLERQYFCSKDRETIVDCKIHSMIDFLSKNTKTPPGYNVSWPQQLFDLFSSLSDSQNVEIENIFEFHFDLVYFHRKLKKFVYERDRIVTRMHLLTIYLLKLLIEELKLFLVRPMYIQKCSDECNTEFERVLDFFVCKYRQYGAGVRQFNTSSYISLGFETFYKQHVERIVRGELPIKRQPEFFVQNQILSTTNFTGPPLITKVYPPIAKMPITISGIIPCQPNILLPMCNNGLVIPAINSQPPTPSLLLPMHSEDKDLMFFLKNLKFDSYSKTTLDITIQKTQNIFEIIKSSVKKMLDPIFPHVQIYPYGSTYLGIVKSNQYYNFFVSLSDCIYKPAPLTVKSLELLANTIKDMLVQDKDWTEINIILNRDFYLCGKYQLNDKMYRVLFTFNNGIEMCTSNLFQYFFELQPLCFEISHILKDWMDVLHLSDTFNGCITTLLVIYYFQQLKYLPSVEVLQLRSSCIEKIENWQCSFEKKSREDLGLTEVPHEQGNKLLCDLFHFYGSIFSFNTHVIVPYVGHPIAKAMFNLGHESQLPYSMRLYKENIQSTAVGDGINYFNNKTPICIQDPFCLINNVSWRIDLNSLNKFTLFCNISSNVYSTFTSGLISY